MTNSATLPTWLITGAQGFLGANLGAFLDHRATRVGIARKSSPSLSFDQMLGVDLVEPDALEAAVAETRPDVIVHAAALSSHEACESDPALAQVMNVDVTDRLAKAAESCGAKFILISTDAVFDGQRGDYRESDETNPFSVYGRTKLEGEKRAAEATQALILRTNFFGWSPTGKRSILEFFVNELSAGNSVRGFTDFTVTSMYAQHLAKAIWQLGNLSDSGVIHVASRDALTKYDFGIAVANRFGLPEDLISPVASDPTAIPARSRNISLNTDKLSGILGEHAPSQGEGIDAAHNDAATVREHVRNSSDA
jgi:dTDP-4-dehydrorhamnose reductase